jgi:protein-disulfide isomerase
MEGRMSRKSRRNRPAPQSPAPVQEKKGPEDGGSGRGVIIALIVAAVAVIVAAVFLLDDRKTETPSADTGADAALASEHAPTLGDSDAKVHIVEFIDPACETCALFYPAVKQLMDANPGRIRLSLRHVPFHQGSEFAVRVLEASREQNKYWETLETLLATQPRWAVNHVVQPNLVLQAIAPVGLDMDKLQADMQSPEVNDRLQRDRADAAALKVRATPEYYVNGQPLPSFGWEPLQALVRAELEAAY